MRRKANLEELKESNDAADKTLAKHIESVERQLKLTKTMWLPGWRWRLTPGAHRQGAEALDKRLASGTEAELYQRQVNANLAQDEIKRIQNLITAREIGYAKAAELLRAWVVDSTRAGEAWADGRKKATDKADEWAARGRADAKTQEEKDVKEALERADAEAKAKYDAVLKESEAYPEAAAKYKAYLEERRKAYLSYSEGWLEIDSKLAKLEAAIQTNRATATADEIANMEDLSRESIRSARERLVAARTSYEGMGEAGQEAVKVIQKALDELARTEA